MAKLTQEEILSYLDEATILELNELVKAIEEKYGVTAAAPVAAAAAPAEEAAAAAPANVTVVLSSFGDKKVAVIKEGLDLHITTLSFWILSVKTETSFRTISLDVVTALSPITRNYGN